MTDFDTRFAARSFPRLLARHGESIVYRPKNGRARTITAIVQRDAPAQAVEHNLINKDVMTVEVLADEVDGIGLRELNTNGDTIEFPKRKSGESSTLSIAKLVNQEGGILTLEVR